MEQTTTTFSTGVRWGLIIGGLLIAYDLITYLAGMKDLTGEGYAQYGSYLIFIIGIVMAIKYFRDNNEGFLSLGQAMGSGVITAIVAGVVTAAWIIIFFNFIDTGMLDEVRELSKEQALASGNMTEEQYESMEGMMNAFTSPAVMAIMSVVINAIFGAIISLIAGLIMKKKAAGA